MRKLILLLGCLPFLTLSQNIDHWETIIFDNDIWKYLEGTYEPDTNWRKLNFNDTRSSEIKSGILYDIENSEKVFKVDAKSRIKDGLALDIKILRVLAKTDTVITTIGNHTRAMIGLTYTF